jgi:hypothetical protein
MLGPTKAFSYNSSNDLKSTNELAEHVFEGIQKICDEYYITKILKIQFIVKQLNIDEGLKLQAKVSHLKEIDKFSDIKTSRSRAIPLIFGWNTTFENVPCELNYKTHSVIVNQSDTSNPITINIPRLSDVDID